MSSLVAVLAFVFLFAGAQALKCYECTDCGYGGFGRYGAVKACNEDRDVCMKVLVGNHIVRQCAEEHLCGLGKLERASDRAWANVANAFRDVDREPQQVYCCEYDLCNGAMQKLPSFAILLLPFLAFSIFKN